MEVKRELRKQIVHQHDVPRFNPCFDGSEA